MNSIIDGDVSLDETLSIYENLFDDDVNNENIDADKQLHKWLTELKTYRILYTKTKEEKDVSIFAHLTLSSYKTVFNSNDINMEKKDNSYLIFMPAAIIEISYDEDIQNVVCIISLHIDANVTVVAEIINMIKNIFKENVIINHESFIVDDATKEFLWGDKEINNYKRRIIPKKIKHTIIFKDSEIGNC